MPLQKPLGQSGFLRTAPLLEASSGLAAPSSAWTAEACGVPRPRGKPRGGRTEPQRERSRAPAAAPCAECAQPNAVSSPRALIGHGPGTWALIGQAKVLARPCAGPPVSKLGGPAGGPVKGAWRVTLGPRRRRYLGTSYPSRRRGAVRCGVTWC